MKKFFSIVFLAVILSACGKNPILTVDQEILIKVGEQKQITAKLEHSTNDIMYESLDLSIATVSETGMVKGIKTGETKVTVTVKDTKIKKEVTVKVTEEEGPTLTLNVSGPSQLRVTDEGVLEVTTNDTAGVTYASSDSTVVSVTDTGIIKALKRGEATITVTSKTDESLFKTHVVTVIDAIGISALDIIVFVGEEIDISYETNDPLGITITSENEEVAAISANKVTGISVGETTLKLTSKTNPSYSITVTVSVVDEPVIIIYVEETIGVSVGDIFEIEFYSSHDVTITIEDEDVIESNQGLYEALKVGETTITFTLDEYPYVVAEVVVTVYEVIEIEVEDEIELKIQEELEVPYTSNATLVLTSGNEDIFTVDGNKIIGVTGGSAVLTFTSLENPAFSYDVLITVLPMPTKMTITANTPLVLAETTQITPNFTPSRSFSYLTYTSSNESVATVDEFGVVTAVGLGSAVITATSTIDVRLKAIVSIKVEQISAVKLDLSDGETIVANGYTFKEGLNAYKTLEEALVENPREIILVGTFAEPIIVSQAVILSGSETNLMTNLLEVKTNDVTLKGLNFTGEGRVVVEDVENTIITESTFTNLTYTDAALTAIRTNTLEVSYNTFTLSDTKAILVDNPKAKVMTIKGNTITGASTAVTFRATESFLTSLSMRVMFNIINNSGVAFDIDVAYQEEYSHATSYVRFNQVTNYTMGAIVPTTNLVDFNLNYWGEVPVYEKFTNLGELDLEGYYLDPNDIINEKDYHPNGPAYLEILNDFDEININEVIDIEYKVLPKEISLSSVQVITSDIEKMIVVNKEKMKFVRSGVVSLIVRSQYNHALNDTLTFEIVTDPGIEMIPESVYNNLLVGETLQFNTMVFPSRISEEAVSFSVDNTEVATINAQGLLTAVGTGVVTVKAQLVNDPTVSQTFKLEVYDSLSEANILDFITLSMVNYTTHRSFLTYGATNIQYEGFDSVSRIIFEDLFRDKSMMIEECDSYPTEVQRANCRLLRPGSRPSVAEGLQTHNNKLVHYITFHETGNTNPDQGANSHAIYLINQITGKTALRQASWHFTIDDKELYQHLPTDEMAWHAGDGSRKAGTEWTDTWGNQNIGGGNAHSIGIESSVARTDDILRVWQRGAKLIAELTKEYNLPEENVKFHYDFSAKICPQSMIRAELTWLFYEYVHYQYVLEHQYADAEITFTSHNPEYVDDAGRVINMPNRAVNVSYTVSVVHNGQTYERTFYSYLPGTVH